MNNQNIKIANAPCSWGALEFELEGESLGFEQVLSEIKETGYAGTELGDWGFMPTDPDALNKVLVNYELELLGAFVPVALIDPNAHDAGVKSALRVGELMYEAGYRSAVIVLADENGTVEERTKNAGRVKTEMGLSDSQWRTYAEGTEKVARAVKKKFGMRTVFHHHCAGYVETPEELDKLMQLTDPELLGLCLDMGHFCFGGGDPLEALEKYYGRIWHVHFKDYDPAIGNKVREEGWDYFEAVKNGVFCELGKGMVDFKGIARELKNRNYTGWIVVEQDVLPGMGDPKSCAKANFNFIKSLKLE